MEFSLIERVHDERVFGQRVSNIMSGQRRAALIREADETRKHDHLYDIDGGDLFKEEPLVENAIAEPENLDSVAPCTILDDADLVTRQFDPPTDTDGDERRGRPHRFDHHHRVSARSVRTIISVRSASAAARSAAR